MILLFFYFSSQNSGKVLLVQLLPNLSLSIYSFYKNHKNHKEREITPIFERKLINWFFSVLQYRAGFREYYNNFIVILFNPFIITLTRAQFFYFIGVFSIQIEDFSLMFSFYYSSSFVTQFLY